MSWNGGTTEEEAKPEAAPEKVEASYTGVASMFEPKIVESTGKEYAKLKIGLTKVSVWREQYDSDEPNPHYITLKKACLEKQGVQVVVGEKKREWSFKGKTGTTVDRTVYDAQVIEGFVEGDASPSGVGLSSHEPNPGSPSTNSLTIAALIQAAASTCGAGANEAAVVDTARELARLAGITFPAPIGALDAPLPAAAPEGSSWASDEAPF